jgi:hypothetical protein
VPCKVSFKPVRRVVVLTAQGKRQDSPLYTDKSRKIPLAKRPPNIRGGPAILESLLSVPPLAFVLGLTLSCINSLIRSICSIASLSTCHQRPSLSFQEGIGPTVSGFINSTFSSQGIQTLINTPPNFPALILGISTCPGNSSVNIPTVSTGLLSTHLSFIP